MAAAGRSLFRIRQYDCIGFDMDHTLCRYRLPAFFEMEYQVLADYLINQRGYDARLKRPLAEDVDFLHKGLIMDVERGNFVKLSAKGDILRASHGTKPMTTAEITSQYGPLRSNESLRRLAVDPIDATEGLIHRKYRPFKDYFDLPAALMCARIVDLLDFRNENKPLDKYTFWRDVLCGLVDMFSRDNLRVNKGGYYPQIKSNPGQFLYPCNDHLKKWLTDLKKRQVTFLISGSDPEYVEWVAGYCLGRDWRSYFDYIVCASKKPSFFTGKRNFRRWNYHLQGVEDEDIETGQYLEANTPYIYIQGNWTQLKFSMAEFCDQERPKCLYFGDHLIQDVVAADLCRLDVVAIVEELDAENHDGSLLNSKRWGSFFYDDGLCSDHLDVIGSARMNTLWSNILEKHARLCIAHMEAISDYPVDHGFTIANGQQNKFLGFLPSLPKCLM